MKENLIKIAYNGNTSEFEKLEANLFKLKDSFNRGSFKAKDYYSLAKFITVGQVGERFKNDNTFYYCVRDITNDEVLFIYFVEYNKMKIFNVQ